MSATAVVPRVVGAPAHSTHSTVRLTRRGRVVVFLAAFIAVLLAAVAFAGVAVGTSEEGERPVTRVITVAPGDTLWDIADEVGGDRRETIREIQQLNALNSAEIGTGQRLVLPVRG